MKNNSKVSRSRWLLLTLFALLVGSGPAWAQQALPYSYGFENNNLADEGWTIFNKNNSTSISIDAKHEGSYGFLFYYQTTKAQYLVSPELTGATANGVKVEFYYANYSSSYPEQFQVGYSTTTSDPTVENVFTWDDVVTVPSDVAFHFYSHSFDAAVKYIAIRYINNNTYKLYVDDIIIKKNITGPGLSVLDGGNEIVSPYNYNFGLAESTDTKTFTLKNPGTESIELNIEATSGFGVSPSHVTIAAKAQETLTVSMAESTASGAVTITPVENVDPFTINVSGTLKDPAKNFQDFQSSTPEGWTKGSWSITTSGSGTSNNQGYASTSSYTSSGYLISGPLTKFDGTEKLIFNAAYTSDYSPFLKVQKSTDGINWTDVYTVPSLTSNWATYEVTMPEGIYYIGFLGKYCYLTDIYGGSVPDAPTDVTVSNITADGATIGWTKLAGQTAWQVSYSTASGNPDNGTKVSADSESKAIAGLSENTTYYVYVRADKGGDVYGDWSVAASFTTTQNPVDLSTGSFADDFEGTNNWVFVNGNLTNAWAIGSATSNGGTKSMYISNDGGTTYAYTLSAGYTVTYATKLFTLTEGKYDISYDWKGQGESTYDFMRAGIVPASVVLSAGNSSAAVTAIPASGTPSGWTTTIDGGGKLNLQENWQSKAVETTIPADGNYMVVFVWRNDNSSGTSPAAAIDNFSIAKQACPKPTNVAYSDVTANVATLNWDNADDTTWEVYISTESTKPAAEQVATASPTTNTYQFTGLTAETHYYAWVRAVKNAAKSDWAGVDFTTNPNPISSFPFSENFDGINSGIPAHWDNSEGTTETDSYKWNYYATGHGDESHCVRFNSFNNPEDKTNFLKTPIMNLPNDKDMQLSFWYKNPTGGDFSVYISKDGGKTYETALVTGLTGQTDWEQQEIVLPNEFQRQNNIVIVFKGTSNYADGDAYVYLDDMTLDEVPACPKPTGLTASNRTWQGATLAWTAGSTETKWKVIYGAAGFNPASAGTTIDNVTENPYTLTGLYPETEYDVYVKAVIDENVSPVSNKANFTTTERYPAPANLAISNLTTTSATLTWNAAGESSWEVAINTTGATPATEAGTGTVVNTATYDFSGLTTETTYYAFVRVKDGENFSNWSTACEFTPSAYTYLTVNDGATTNTYTPIYGYFSAASNLGGQFIIPAANLTEVQNKVIKKLTFYSNTSEYDYGEAEFDVCIKEVANATMTSSMYDWNDASWTTVYNGTLSIVGGKMTITFSSDYNYNGSNLLVGIHKTSNDKSGSNYNVAFYGTNASSGNYRSNYAPNGNRQLFQPKTTIGYQEKAGAELKVYDGETELTESPASFDFGFVTAGTTHTFTLKNTAATSYTATVSSTNLTVSPTTAITPDADGETFTVTMPDHDITNEPVVITPEDGKGLTAFTINVSGRYRDASKIYVDFTSENIPSTWTASKWYRSSYNGYIYDDGTTAESHAELTTSRIVSTNENLTLSAKLKTDAGILNVWWSADGTEWLEGNKTELKTLLNTTEFRSINVNVPAAAQYVKFEGYNAYIKSIYGLADAPLMKVRKTADGANLATPQTVDFGLTASADAETFYVVNASAGSLVGVDAALTGTGFTLTKTNLTAAGGDFTIAVDPTVKGYREATVTVSGTDQDNFVINLKGFVSGAEGKMHETFNTESHPTGWTATGFTATAEGETLGENGSGTLRTTLMSVEANEKLAIRVKANKSSSLTDLKVKFYQKGANDPAATVDLSGVLASNTDEHTVYASIATAGNYYVEFDGSYISLLEVAGFAYNANDPTIAVYSDALATQEVATATTKDFGWLASNADAAAFTSTYYIKNNGTGTLTISNISEVEGFTAATAENAMTVSGDNTLALTISMDKNAVGAKNGTFTLTTDGGNFTIPVKGFVYDNTKNLVDFTANGAKFPAGWTAGSWTISDGAATSTSESTIQTKKLTVAANENLYVDIKGNSGNGTKTLAYSYSTDNGANWSQASTLISETDYVIVADQVLTISDIASATETRTVLVRITGQNLGIKHIYGFTRVDEAVMTTTAAAHDFGMQASNADPAANAYVFTVTNEGNIDLTNLAVTLENGNESAFAVAVAGNKTSLAAGESADVTVTMKSSTVYGAKNDNMTIAADGQTPVVIALSGKTRDVAKQFIDFSELDAIPAGWTAGSWTVSTPPASTDKAAYVSNESTMISPAMTIAANEKLYFDARVLAAGSLTVSYTTDGGATWNVMSNLVAQNAMTAQELSFGNDAAVTAFVKFTGKSAYIDNIYGGLATTAPLMDITTTEVADGNGKYDFGQNLMADPANKVFTITNIGSTNLVATIAATGDVTAEFETTGTKNGNEVTLANGQTATITVSMAYAAENAGAKAGAVTITSAAGVATLNFTGKTIDNRTLSVDFADGLQPEGWYFGTNWSVNAYSQYASNDVNATPGDLITQQLIVDGAEDALTFNAAKTNNSYTFKVYTSQDRVEWTEYDLGGMALTESNQTVTVNGLAAGNYYLKISGAFVRVDDFLGWKKATGITRDLYVAETSYPEAQKGGAAVNITAKVTSLRANETGVYAKLFVNGAETVAADAQDIDLNAEKTFTFNYTMPAAAGNYSAYIKVYYSDNSEAFTTATETLKVYYEFDEDVDPGTIVVADANAKYDAMLKHTLVNGWNTICLPFAVASEDVTTLLGASATIYEYQGKDNDKLQFAKVTSMVAGTPYLIYVTTAKTINTLVTDVVLDTEANDVSSTFFGTYAPMAAGSLTGKYGVTPSNQLAKGNSNTTMKGFRGYFDGSVAGARICIFDETTGISRVYQGAEVFGDNDRVYNMNGQHVENAKNGVYIVNGRKVMIKNK